MADSKLQSRILLFFRKLHLPKTQFTENRKGYLPLRTARID